MSRSPRSAASRTCRAYSSREPGVPPCTSTGRPAGSPASSTASSRPSLVRTVRSTTPTLRCANVVSVLQGEPGDADVLPAVPRVDGGAPLPRERLEQRQPGAVGGRDRQVNVLERPLERELGGEVPAGPFVQLGVRQPRVERPALDRRVQVGRLDAEPGGQLK